MRNSIIWLGLLAVLAAFAGCNSSGTGGVKTGNGATISVMAVSTLPAPAVASAASAVSMGTASTTPKEDHGGEDGDGTLIEVSANYANIEFIQLDLPEGATCDSFGSFEFLPPVSCSGGTVTVEGPFVVDLTLGTTIPSTGDLTIPPGLYKHVTLRFGPSTGVNLPVGHPLIGHSFYAEGFYWLASDTPPPAAGRQFTMALDINVDPQFDSPAGISVTSYALDKVLLTLDVASWFTSLHIGSCVEDLAVIPPVLNLPSDLTGDCDITGVFKDNVENSGDLTEEGG